MVDETKPYQWYLDRVRLRYRPRHGLARGMVAAAPWADVILLVVLFLLLQAPFILRAGLVVELPRAPLASGTRYGATAVVLSMAGAEPGAAQEIVFFDDDRFPVRPMHQMDALREALARAAAGHPDQPLIIEADRRVRHGTIMQLINLAAEAGIGEVNVATRPGEEEP